MKQDIPHVAARVKKPAYGMNDAPRRWWNRLDAGLQSLGWVPVRADRCLYVHYAPASQSNKTWRQTWSKATAWTARFTPQPLRASASGTGTGSSEASQSDDPTSLAEDQKDWLDMAVDYLLDPVSGSPTKGKTVDGAMLIHVDDLLLTGTESFNQDMAKQVGTLF